MSKWLQAFGCVFMILFTQGMVITVTKYMAETNPVLTIIVPIIWIVGLTWFFRYTLKDVE